MAYCGKCGTKLEEGAKFCPQCGYTLNMLSNKGNSKAYIKFFKRGGIFLLLVFLVACVWLVYKGKNGYSVTDFSKEISRNISQKSEKESNQERSEVKEDYSKKEDLPSSTDKFYNLANVSKHKWIAKSIYSSAKTYLYYDSNYRMARSPYTVCLYFYPNGKNSGQVSVVYFKKEYTAYAMAYSSRVSYVIQDDNIIFTARYNPFGGSRYEFDDFVLRISPDNGEYLERLQTNTPQEFRMISKDMIDPVSIQ